jgi:release factor glutamine methyltransferase
MTLQTALLEGTRLLEDGAVPVPRLTAEVLLTHALGRERSYLYGHPEEELTELAWIHYGRYLYERLQGKPTQYITRRQEFYGRDFRVTPDVLIPRPETEHVIEVAKSYCGAGGRVVDVGCGSGAIAVTLALETPADVWATDLSDRALRVATENSQRLSASVKFILCDLLSALRSASFDVVASNPPYVPEADAPGLQREVRDWEPRLALFAGPTGLEVYERLVAEAARVLRPSGHLVVELGYHSLEPVRRMLASGWTDLRVTDDLAGLPRVLSARVSR